MPAEVQNQLRTVVKNGAEETVFEWQKAAPVSSDPDPTDWEGKPRKKLRDAFEYRLSKTGLTAKIGLLGKSSEAFFFWRFLEFGTRRGVEKKPFIWPTWNRIKKTIRRDVKAAVLRGLRNVARSNPSDA
jgi:HK97 gp10 family phage protein